MSQKTEYINNRFDVLASTQKLLKFLEERYKESDNYNYDRYVYSMPMNELNLFIRLLKKDLKVRQNPKPTKTEKEA